MRMLSLVLLAGALAAQEPAVRGPSLGLVCDPEAHAVRPILGIPGAATLGSAWNSDLDIATCEPSPGGEFAIASTADRRLFVLRPGSAPVLIDGLAGTVRFSPSGKTAVVIGTGRVDVLAGLPESPSPKWGIDAAASQAAVSDDASTLIYTDDTGTYGVSDFGSIRLLPPASAAAFFPGTRDAVLAVPPARTVYLVKDIAGNAETSVIAAESDGVRSPSGLAAVPGRAIVANGAGQFLVVDLKQGAVRVLDCDCDADFAAPLNGAAVLRVTREGQALRILDLDSERLFFVPPAAAAAGGNAQ